MHSGRMRTVRCSGHPGGCLLGGGVYLEGGVYPAGWCVSRGCLPRGGGVCPGGCLPRVGVPPTPLPPWTEFLAHACENITFPQLLLQTATRACVNSVVIWLLVNEEPYGLWPYPEMALTGLHDLHSYY